MQYILTLIFSCGHGCGSPAQVTLPTPYVTQQQCSEAGKVWLSPNANPTRTLRDYRCDISNGVVSATQSTFSIKHVP